MSCIGTSAAEHHLAAAGDAYHGSESAGTDGLVITVCKGHENLHDRLNTTLAAMQADGTLDTFNTRWF